MRSLFQRAPVVPACRAEVSTSWKAAGAKRQRPHTTADSQCHSFSTLPAEAHGGVGADLCLPLTFQLELQKSREAAAELHSIQNAIHEVHDTLGGGNVSRPPLRQAAGRPDAHPSVSVSRPQAPVQTSLVHPNYPPPPSHHPATEELQPLRSQLTDTQAILGDTVSRVQTIEVRLKDHDGYRTELEQLRAQLGSLRHRDGDDDDEVDGDDDDDTRSVGTVRARGRRRYDDVEESTEDADLNGVDGNGVDGNRSRSRSIGSNGADEGPKERGERLGRPSTPEPTGRTSDEDDDDEIDPVKYSPSSNKTSPRQPAQSDEENRAQSQLHEQLQSQMQDTQTVLLQNQALASRLDTLGSELGSALELSRSLQAQHTEALSTVSVLTDRVAELEGKVGEVESKWEFWKGRMEEVWKKEREVWETERERMRGVVKEWEEAKRRAEEEEEERRLNSGDEDDNWSEGGRRAASSSTTLGPNSTAKHILERRGSATPSPNSSPNPKSNYSSLRSLLNPLYSTPSRSAGGHPQRGAVPSSFIGASSESNQTQHPLRKSTSTSTIKGPGSRAANRMSMLGTIGRNNSFDGTQEEDEQAHEEDEDENHSTITGLGEKGASGSSGLRSDESNQQPKLNAVSRSPFLLRLHVFPSCHWH